MRFFLIIGLLYISFDCNSQVKCILKEDSCSLQTPNKKELVDLLDVKIKDNYQVQFVKHLNLFYLKLIIKNDLGFGKTGSLVLLSGKRQNYIKEISLQKIDNNSAYFLLELKPNYLTTLKENGLTSFVFCENREFVIPKTDSESVKKAASCFMETAIKK